MDSVPSRVMLRYGKLMGGSHSLGSFLGTNILLVLPFTGLFAATAKALWVYRHTVFNTIVLLQHPFIPVDRVVTVTTFNVYDQFSPRRFRARRFRLPLNRNAEHDTWGQRGEIKLRSPPRTNPAYPATQHSKINSRSMNVDGL